VNFSFANGKYQSGILAELGSSFSVSRHVLGSVLESGPVETSMVLVLVTEPKI
jgi:hypothetical protein